MSFGVTLAGFSRPSLEEILEEIEQIYIDAFGNTFSLSPDTPQGQIIGSIAAREDILWQAAEALYNQNRPSSASGVPLTQIGAFAGIERREPTKSQFLGTVNAPFGTAVLTSHIVRTDSGDLFSPTADTTTGVLGFASVIFEALEFGPIAVAAGQLNEIVSAGTGWTSVENTLGTSDLPGFVGVDDESDAEFRARYIASTKAQATNVLERLYAELLALSGVTQLRIYVNATNATVDGRPPHSYEVVIQGGDDAEIAEAIWSGHPAGITLFGSESENITDSQGQTQTINFSRPTPVTVAVAVTTSTSTDFPSTGAGDIKASIAAFALTHFRIGDDVNVARLYTPANETPGHVITNLTIDAGTSPVTIDSDEVASITIADVLVNGA